MFKFTFKNIISGEAHDLLFPTKDITAYLEVTKNRKIDEEGTVIKETETVEVVKIEETSEEWPKIDGLTIVSPSAVQEYLDQETEAVVDPESGEETIRTVENPRQYKNFVWSNSN